MSRFVVGLDLGQANDYTAMTVLERQKPTGGLKETTYLVRHLERVRDLPYPKIISKTTKIIESPALAGQTDLVIDQTGCGRPVFDMFKMAGLRPIGIQIHGGDKANSEGDTWRVPKRDLVGLLQVLFQSGRLKISKKLQLAATLQSELLNFRVKIDPKTAHDSYSAWREADHDDLVLSVALAAWWAENQKPKPHPLVIVRGDPIVPPWRVGHYGFG